MQMHLPTLSVAAFVRRALTMVALGTSVGLVACGGGGGGSSTAPATNTGPVIPTGPSNVTVQNNSFAPTAVTVAPGTTVTWTWNTCNDATYGGGAGTCVAHNIVWDADGTGSGLQSEGSYTRTFSAAGTFAYHCAVHGAAMTGTVKVQ